MTSLITKRNHAAESYHLASPRCIASKQMNIANNETEVLHPEGKIQLMNGNILECYPETVVSDGVKQDACLNLTQPVNIFGSGICP